MNVTIFPAQTGTFLIERDPATSPPVVTHIPVIGWQHLQGNLAFPIAVMNHGGLTHGKAILHPNGYVSDPTHGLTFENLAEWLSFIKSAKPKAGPKMPQESGQSEPDNRAAVMPDTPEPPKPRARPAAPQATGGAIQFGTKTFSTNSFWRLKSSNIDEHDPIFQIEGGHAYPKDARCEKIKRDEYAALKKAGSPVIDPHAAAKTEAEDDAMDLV
jgi:hypothetical protein